MDSNPKKTQVNKPYSVYSQSRDKVWEWLDMCWDYTVDYGVKGKQTKKNINSNLDMQDLTLPGQVKK